MPIGAGDLRERIVIERATEVPNEFNEPVLTWSEYVSRRARRQDASSGERDAAGQVGAFLMSRFAIRRDTLVDAVKPSDRINTNGATWSIKEIKRLQESPEMFLEITAVRDLD